MIFAARNELDPHKRLLLSCATFIVDKNSRRAVRAALSDPRLDWPAAVRASVRHGVASYVALHLREVPRDSPVPREAAAAFDRMFEGNARRNEVLFRETARLVRALEGAGIPSLVLKGVALAVTIYPDHALRNCADIDILVPPSNYAAAVEVAEEQGFRRDSRTWDAHAHHCNCSSHCSEDILTDTLAPEFDPSLRPEVLAPYRHRVPVEIHRSLFRGALGLCREVDAALLWESPQTAALPDGTPIRIPSPEVMLVHLAVHASDHAFNRLIFPIDIAAWIGRHGPAMDWDRVVCIADRCHDRLYVRRVLDLVRREFGACVPPGVLERLLPAEKARAVPPLSLSTVFCSTRSDRSEVFLRLWCLEQGPGRRAIVFLRVLFPSPRAMRRIYGVRNPLLIASLYALRPFQLAGRLIRSLPRLRRQNRPG